MVRRWSPLTAVDFNKASYVIGSPHFNLITQASGEKRYFTVGNGGITSYDDVAKTTKWTISSNLTRDSYTTKVQFEGWTPAGANGFQIIFTGETGGNTMVGKLYVQPGKIGYYSSVSDTTKWVNLS